ncbi:L [Southwest carpet python virus]|uniref:RNA-directed RNA polymerase n=1 Tax=Southwest carpet python virus TaxID=2016402 RepID=A0A2K8MNF1_9MONO|nr:L [Southwest carpet python virus] [Southwest carpet python virus]ATY47618.1 L [Southwest carpet python virus] [Southwest carpet python virus]
MDQEKGVTYDTINRTDQTLKSPLLGTEVMFCIDSMRKLGHHSRALQKVISTQSLIPSRLYYRIFIPWINKPSPAKKHSVISAAAKTWAITARTWGAAPSLIDRGTKAIQAAFLHTQAISLIEKHREIQSIIKRVSFTHEADILGQRLDFLRLDFVQSLVVVTDTLLQTQCLMTYNHFLAVADTIKSRMNLLLTSIVSDTLQRSSHLTTPLFFTLMTETDKSALVLPDNTYFQGIKSILGYCQGLVLRYHNSSDLPSDFFKVTETSVVTLSACLAQMIDVLSKSTPVTSLEVCAVNKIYFFPEIDMEAGAREQFQKMRANHRTSSELLKYGQSLSYVFTAEYIRGYLHKHGVWPPCSVTCPTLAKYRARSLWPSFAKYSHFKKVTLEYSGTPFDTEPDIADLVTDKSIVESREHWTFEYNSAAHIEKHRKKLIHPPYRGEKRLVKALISGKLDNIPAILAPYCQGMIQPRNCLTVLVPKEKELKKHGRFFSVQTLHNRVFQVVSELNLKNRIMPYINTHSMTMTSTRLSHVLIKLSKVSSSGKNFVINLDYSSWCNYFRPEVQHDTCKIIDNVLGSGRFYQLGSILPRYLTFIIQDKFNPPQQGEDLHPIEDHRTCVHGTGSSGEGMRQKLWTVLASCSELLALEEAGVTGTVFGQGDNQTIIVDSGGDKSGTATRVLESLRKNAEEMGHQLKTDECWVSDCLYEYGKKQYFKGTAVPNIFKIISRVSDSTGEIFPNLYSKLACLVSSCESAAQADHSPWCTVVVGSILYHIEATIQLPSDICSNIDRIVAASVIGPPLGGLPTVALSPAAFFRGVSDSLPLQLSLLKTALDLGVSPLILDTMSSITPSSAISYLSLISDPSSLNIDQPLRPERVLRDWIEEALLDQGQSTKLSVLFSESITSKAEILSRDLAAMDPMYPRVMSAIFDLSNVSYGLSLLDKFQKSSTIISTSQELCFSDLVLESKRYRHEVVAWLRGISVGSVSVQLLNQGCTARTADRLRMLTWKRPLYGVTMPFIGEQFKLYSEVCPSQVPTSIIYNIQDPITFEHLLVPGSCKFYMGSKTFIKIIRGHVSNLSSKRLETMSENLMALVDWFNLKGTSPESNLQALLDVLLEEKGVKRPQCRVVAGGTLTHRLPSRSEARDGLAGSMNHTSRHVSFTTDFMTKYTKSGDDYTIHFQQAFIHGHNLISGLLLSGQTLKGHLYLSEWCSSCTQLIPPETFDLTSPPSYKGLPMLAPAKIHHLEWEPETLNDPYHVLPYLVADEIFSSFWIESRQVSTGLAANYCISDLERMSLAQSRFIIWSVVTEKFWFLLLKRLYDKQLIAYLTRCRQGLVQSDTLSWVLKTTSHGVFQDNLLDMCSRTRTGFMTPTLSRQKAIVKILLLPLFRRSYCEQVIKRKQKKFFGKCAVDPKMTLDTALALIKTEPIDLSPTVLSTTEYGIICNHPDLCLPMSLAGEGIYISQVCQMFKGFISMHHLTSVALSESVPASICVDICHVCRVILLGKNTVEKVDRVINSDICDAARENLLIAQSILSFPESRVIFSMEPLESKWPNVLDVVYPTSITPCEAIGMCRKWSDLALYSTATESIIDLSSYGCKSNLTPLCPSVASDLGMWVEDALQDLEDMAIAIVESGSLSEVCALHTYVVSLQFFFGFTPEYSRLYGFGAMRGFRSLMVAGKKLFWAHFQDVHTEGLHVKACNAIPRRLYGDKGAVVLRPIAKILLGSSVR